MRLPDPPLPDVFTRAQALAAGLSSDQVRTRVRRDSWYQLRRGAYCLTADWLTASSAQRHWLVARACVATARTPVWVSHASAAAGLGLPTPRGGSPAWLTRLPEHGTWYSPGLKIEAATLPLADQWVRDGVPITSLRRTVADSARHELPPDGLAIADAAIRRDPRVGQQVAEVLESCADWPYAARGHEVVGLASGRRESPLESWSCWFMHQFRVPTPMWQVDIYDAEGRFLGRVDAWWPELGVVGEADGRTKYLPAAAAGLSAAEAARIVYDEKRREDALRRTGAHVVRWGSADLRSPAQWAAWLCRELSFGTPTRFRGRAVLSRISA